ncbi:MAG: hypothetical protein QXR44_05085 [Thermoproteota archaeon]
MEIAIKIDENRLLLAIFSTVVMTSIFLILFKSFWFNFVSESLGITEFQLTLTPEFVIVKNPYGSIINPYIISESGSKIREDSFPLKLPRFIKIQDKTINIKTWNLKICNALLLKNTEINRDRIVQRAHIIDLKIHLRVESEEASSSSSRFTLSFENVETPYEVGSNEAFSGSLEPLTGHLYGGFYPHSKSEIKIIITWEPVDKPVLLTLYYENNEAQHYLLTGGEWTGSDEILKDGLNYLVIGNPDQIEEISYFITIIKSFN